MLEIFVHNTPVPSLAGRASLLAINTTSSALRSIGLYGAAMALVAHAEVLGVCDDKIRPLRVFLCIIGYQCSPAFTYGDFPAIHGKLRDYLTLVSADGDLEAKMEYSPNYANLPVMIHRDLLFWPSIYNRFSLGFEHGNQVCIPPFFLSMHDLQ